MSDDDQQDQAAELAHEDQAAEVEQPTTGLLLAGTFAIYEDGKGGLVLVADTPAHGVIRKRIPAALIKMATGGGVFGKRFASIFGG